MVPKIIINTREDFENLIDRWGPTVDYYTAHMLLGISVQRIDQLVRRGQYSDIRIYGKRSILLSELLNREE